MRITDPLFSGTTILSGSMSMSGSMSVNNQTLDQYISGSVISQGLSGGSDTDLGVYGLVGLAQEYYAIAATS